MSAYVFTGWISQFQKGRYAEWCSTLVVYGGEEEASWKTFENFLLQYNHGEDVTPIKVEKMIGAPVQEQILTESGPAPIDWAALGEEAQRALETAGADYAEAGYWADGNELIQPAHLSPSLESLQKDLPEDVRTGLNWSPDKNFLFLISVLSPPPPPPQDLEEDLEEEDPAKTEERRLRERQAAYPELADKELAVLVRARNSVVAVWLWRRQATGTSLAGHAVRLDGWCGAAPCAPASESAPSGQA